MIQKSSANKQMSFSAWLTVLFYVFYISGFRSVYVNYISSAMVIGLTIAYLVFRRKYFSDTVMRSGRAKAFIVFMMLVFYYLYIFGDGGVKYTVNRYVLYFPMIVFLYYEKEEYNLKGIFWCLIIAWVFFAFRAYYMYSNDIIEARGIASHSMTDNVLTGGGYGFAYGSSIIAVFLFEMLLWKNIKKHKIWIATFVILLLMVVLETRSTLTIIAVMLGLATGIIFKLFNVNTIKNISISHFFLLVFVVIMVIIFVLYREELGLFIIRQTNNADDIVGKRIHEIGIFFARSGSDAFAASDFNGRLNRLNSSWDMFLENPLFGVLCKYGSNSHVLKMKGLGSHGEFLDILAKYGIVGGGILLGVYFFTILNERKSQNNKIGFGYLVTFFIMFFFNPFISNQSSTVFFFLIPAMTKLFNCDRVMKEEGNGKNEDIHNAGTISL